VVVDVSPKAAAAVEAVATLRNRAATAEAAAIVATLHLEANRAHRVQAAGCNEAVHVMEGRSRSPVVRVGDRAGASPSCP